MNNINTIVRLENYPKAFSEVNAILKFFPENYIKKIPLSFREYLKQNMDNNYTLNISNLDELPYNQLSYETKVILSLIYRSYICTPEEREILEKKDLEEIKEFQEKYSAENLFKNKKSETINESNEEKALVEIVKKESWYIKIRNLLRGFWRKVLGK